MGRKSGKDKRADTSNHMGQQNDHRKQEKMLERFLAATIEELILAIS